MFSLNTLIARLLNNELDMDKPYPDSLTYSLKDKGHGLTEGKSFEIGFTETNSWVRVTISVNSGEGLLNDRLF